MKGIRLLMVLLLVLATNSYRYRYKHKTHHRVKDKPMYGVPQFGQIIGCDRANIPVPKEEEEKKEDESFVDSLLDTTNKRLRVRKNKHPNNSQQNNVQQHNMRKMKKLRK